MYSLTFKKLRIFREFKRNSSYKVASDNYRTKYTVHSGEYIDVYIVYLVRLLLLYLFCFRILSARKQIICKRTANCRYENDVQNRRDRYKN